MAYPSTSYRVRSRLDGAFEVERETWRIERAGPGDWCKDVETDFVSSHTSQQAAFDAIARIGGTQ